MTRPTATQKQLLTFRQGVTILAIFLLSVFAFKYAQNVMRIRAAQEELAELEGAVAGVQEEQAAVDEDFVNSMSPAEVEAFAKEEMGWVQRGELIYIPIPAAPSTEGETNAPARGNSQEKTPPPPNWRQWMALITDAGD